MWSESQRRKSFNFHNEASLWYWLFKIGVIGVHNFVFTTISNFCAKSGSAKIFLKRSFQHFLKFTEIYVVLLIGGGITSSDYRIRVLVYDRVTVQPSLTTMDFVHNHCSSISKLILTLTAMSTQWVIDYEVHFEVNIRVGAVDGCSDVYTDLWRQMALWFTVYFSHTNYRLH
jgi:hypothetical protein